MKRLLSAISLCALGLGAGLSVPVAAQDQPGDKVNQLIIYGDDACPAPVDGEITVCARKAEEERYRIPEPLRESSSPQNRSWTDRVLAYETVGRTGIMSCSPVGAGGETGCTQKLIDAAYGERRGASDVRFGQLIEEARAERLETLDQEAAEQQSRVEEIEREYDERLAAERAAGEGDPAAEAREELPALDSNP